MAITLENSDLNWLGTFAEAVEFIAKDILSDAVEVVPVTVRDGDGNTVWGALMGVEDGHLVVGRQRIVIADNITGFYVA
ncbi:hypothetical protein [Nocardia rhizosphaerae]|uniref:Immunity protein 35 n=1 Tax=Nocardia rhizosphaerae TaxID=1691571 RepID=A0ABV8LF28_9NOCA